MKLFKKAAALATALCMSLSGVGVLGVEALADEASSFSTIGGWYETAYATWSDTNAVGAGVYYKAEGADDSDYVQLNASSDAVNTSLSVYDGSSYDNAAGYKKCVVRQTDSGTGRVDIMGIGYGSFDIKVAASDGTIYEDTVDILQEDRSGYAHFGASDSYIGAYNDDGTLKEDADIIYVTEANKNSVVWVDDSTDKKYTGIGKIASNIYRDTVCPIDIRFLGEVDTTSWEAASYSDNTYYINESAGKSAGYYEDWKGVNNYYADTTNTGVAIENLNTKVKLYQSANSVSVTTLEGSSASIDTTSSTASSAKDEDTSLNMMDFKGGSSTSPVYIPELTIEGIGSDTVAKN